MDPVRDQSTPSHRQQRLGGTGQVSEPPAAVSQHVPLEPGPITGGENYSLHLKSGHDAHLLAVLALLALLALLTVNKIKTRRTEKLANVPITNQILTHLARLPTQATVKSPATRDHRGASESKRFRLQFSK